MLEARFPNVKIKIANQEKTFHSNSLQSFYFITILFLLFGLALGNYVEPRKDYSGIYFNSLSYVGNLNSEWNIATTFPLKIIDEKLDQLEMMQGQLENIAKNLSLESSIEITSRQISQTELAYSNLITTTENHQRRKRGLINPLSTFQKWLDWISELGRCRRT